MRGTRRRHGTGPDPPGIAGPALKAATSVGVMLEWSRGSSRKYHTHSTAQNAVKAPSTTNDQRQDSQVMRKATTGAVAPAPSRPAAWVRPMPKPRVASEVHLESALVAAGRVAPSPMP